MPICDTFSLAIFKKFQTMFLGRLENTTNDKETPSSCTCIIQCNFWTNNIIYHETSTETNSIYEDLKEQNSMEKRET